MAIAVAREAVERRAFSAGAARALPRAAASLRGSLPAALCTDPRTLLVVVLHPPRRPAFRPPHREAHL
eukprot:4945812-Prymnesium_polylepis.1